MAAGGPILRLEDRPVGPGGRRSVLVSWAAPGYAPRAATVSVDVAVDAGAAERLRWYLEDYGEFPTDPAPAIAADTERLLADIGRRLFTAVFGTGVAAGFWAQAGQAGLDRVRVEIDTDPADVPGLPWELLRDPDTGRALVVAVGEFVRTHQETAAGARLPEPGDRLRVLLVICRPEGRDDVPFRSVASRLVRGGAEQLDGLELDILRPPSFARLREAVTTARDRGRPYHVVHFDGHGSYLDATHLDPDPPEDAERDARGGRGGMSGGGGGGVEVSPLRYGPSLVAPARPGRHGYLLFENPGSGSNQQLVDGQTLAGVLTAAGVAVLVLNACRSAYAEAPHTPTPPAPSPPALPAAAAADTADTVGPDPADLAPTPASVHDRIRAYGSLAAEVADAGVAGVVAMRYNVYVVTAAQFAADLYTHLLGGRSLGTAATAARQALAADPVRHIGPQPVALQDWVVPTVYETTPLTLITPPAATPPGQPAPGPSPIRITLTEHTPTRSEVGGVPSGPDVGFYGRDEALLALDRAFDTQRVVLLHALAGAGKTTTAAEFARWYAATGGLNHPDHPDSGAGVVLWSTFEHHLPLARLLDQVGTTFAGLLAANGIEWAALTEPEDRRDVVRQVLAAIPVLWVWDNVEPVAGFPDGTPSAWSEDEQRELIEFLRELKTQTRAKVLLTSRRDEQAWLGGVGVRVRLAAMPMRERLQLAHALVRHLAPDTPPDGGAWQDIDWRGLLRFTGGNPLTITVAIRQALREHVATTEQAARFLARVQAGTLGWETTPDAALGRDGSLAASLSYGFGQAFTERERAVLALLHLFRDTVDIDALRYMGDPDTADTDAVTVLAGHNRDGLNGLLGRAVEVGLLDEYGGGYFGVHPALPWFFGQLFTEHHGPPDSPAAAGVERAYTRAYAELGHYYFGQVEAGESGRALPILRIEEANLLHALELARTAQLYDTAIGCLQGLIQLYRLTGRDGEWARLVTTIQGDYLDPDTDAPLPGRDDYGVVANYRIRIARARRDWPTATRLQTALLAWLRERAAPYLDLPADRLDPTARNRLRNLGVSESNLGNILRQQGDPGCLEHYRTAYRLDGRIGDTSAQAIDASDLGTAYLRVPGVRDLGQAQYWHERNLELKSDQDPIGQAAAHISLGIVAYERFRDAQTAEAPEKVLLEHLNTALTAIQQALELLPPDQHEYRSGAHNQLGVVYDEAGQVAQALHHYQQAIHHHEARGDAYGAGQTRYNIALLLQGAGRVGDALLYARAALTNFREIGPGAASDVDDAEALIERLERGGP